MKRNSLNAKQVAGVGPGEYRDGAGLCLVVTTASKTWVQRYTLNKKRTSTTLGTYPNISLSAARLAGEKIRTAVAQGIPAKVALNADGGVTFEAAIQLWLPTYSSKVETKTKDDALRRLELHAQGIYYMVITTIKPMHIVTAMDPLVANSQFETLSKVIDNIKQVLEHVRIIGLIEYNPAVGLKAVFPQHQVQSFPALPADQLPRIFTAMRNGTMTKRTRDLMLSQILSALRCSEMVAAKWERLDADQIVIDSEFMKGKRFKKQEHVVYLSPLAAEIINRQPKTSVYIYPFRGDATRHANSETITKWLRENGFKGELVTHGFRSMFSTWANAQKQPDGITRLYDKEIVELCIAHKVASVQTIYDRNEYAADRRRVMQGWSDFVQACWQKSVANSGI